MADVLKRLAGPVALVSSPFTVYTVPASTTAVVRNIHVCNEAAVAAAFSISIGVDASAKRLFKDVAIPANGAYDWSGSLVLAAAEVLQASGPGPTTVMTLVISGIEST